MTRTSTALSEKVGQSPADVKRPAALDTVERARHLLRAGDADGALGVLGGLDARGLDREVERQAVGVLFAAAESAARAGGMDDFRFLRLDRGTRVLMACEPATTYAAGDARTAPTYRVVATYGRRRRPVRARRGRSRRGSWSGRSPAAPAPDAADGGHGAPSSTPTVSCGYRPLGANAAAEGQTTAGHTGPPAHRTVSRERKHHEPRDTPTAGWPGGPARPRPRGAARPRHPPGRARPAEWAVHALLGALRSCGNDDDLFARHNDRRLREADCAFVLSALPAHLVADHGERERLADLAFPLREAALFLRWRELTGER